MPPPTGGGFLARILPESANLPPGCGVLPAARDARLACRTYSPGWMNAMQISDEAIRWVATNRAAGLPDTSDARLIVVRPRDAKRFADDVERHAANIRSELFGDLEQVEGRPQ